MSIILGVLNEGLIYALMALGVYITYTILDFPDLSVDSTFPMGAAVTATLILAGMPPVLTLFIAFGAGALAGTVTGLIHVKLKVRDLLSGIIVMTALYSLNLRITGDKANLPIFSRDTIFDNEFVYGLPSPLNEFSTVVILLSDRGGSQNTPRSVYENAFRISAAGRWRQRNPCHFPREGQRLR